jgi:RNA polymerase sigma factor (sigma-70 family)
VRPSAPPFLETTPPSGERPDLDAVHQAYASYVHELVRHRVPPRDVDDLEQQSFLEIHGALPNYDPARPIMPWIKTIVLRTIQNHLQRSSTRCELLVPVIGQDLRSGSEDLVGTLELLSSVLAPLSEPQQSMVVRHLRDGEPVEQIAEDLKLSKSGAYKLLAAARAKLADAVRRHQARERRLLGGRGAFLFLFGLDLRPQVWIMRARSALERAFAAVKAGSASVGASAAVVVALGAVELPVRPSAPAPAAKPASPVAVSVAAAPARMALGGAGALPPPLSMESAAGPSPDAEPDRDAAAEHSSLQRIRAMLKTDPAAALAALELHKKAFPREQFRTDREGIESIARARANPPRSTG